jgi:hypothetical protein
MIHLITGCYGYLCPTLSLLTRDRYCATRYPWWTRFALCGAARGASRAGGTCTPTLGVQACEGALGRWRTSRGGAVRAGAGQADRKNTTHLFLCLHPSSGCTPPVGTGRVGARPQGAGARWHGRRWRVCSRAVPDDLIVVTMGTEHRNEYHHALIAYMGELSELEITSFGTSPFHE